MQYAQPSVVTASFSRIRALRQLTALLALLSPLAAQRTFIVDAANGAGTNFTDLPAALAQAQHRDVFVIRAGTYSPVTTDKGVALLGNPNVIIDAGMSTITTPLQVNNLPDGETFVAKQIDVRGPHRVGVVLTRCGGRVHLSQLRVGPLYYEALRAILCSEVTISDSILGGGVLAGGVGLLVLTRSTLIGHNAVRETSATPGLSTNTSTAVVTDCHLRGGDNWDNLFSPRPPSPAILAWGNGTNPFSGVFLAATSPGSTTLVGGNCVGSPCSTSAEFSAACYLIDESVRYSPNVRLQPGPNAPPFLLSGTAQAIPQRQPALATAGRSLGAQLSVTLSSTPGDHLAILLSLPASPRFSNAGPLLIDVARFVVLTQTTQGASGVTTVSLPVPNDAQLRGQAFVLQAATVDGALQQLYFSNPDVVVFS